MLRGLVIVVPLAACVPEPSFRPRDAAVTDGDSDAVDAPDAAINELACPANLTNMRVTRTGSMMRGASVCGPGYQMVFSDQGARMPYQLNVGSSLLLGNGAVCNEERGAGIGLYPAGLVNGENGNGEGTVSVQLGGEAGEPPPKVVKVVVDWSLNYSCNQGGTLQDRTSFTFFPDGRITRWDRITSATMGTAGNCTMCSGGSAGTSGFVLTSFFTLIADASATLTSGSITTLDQIGEVHNPGQATCLTSLGRRVAFAWRNTTTRVRVVNTTPVRTLAFVYDIRNDPVIPMSFFDTVITQMKVSSATQCADLRDQVVRHVAPQMLLAGSPTGPTPDGIYGGETEFLEPGGFDAPVGPIAITTIDGNASSTIPGNFAVWIEFGAQANQNVQVTRTTTPAGEWFYQQRVSPSQILFWFRDDLPPGQTITITPG